jgi:hypothetical protein
MIGLEINDSGILAAGGNPPRLIELDEQTDESPGFALLQKKELLVGKAAEKKARLFPRQILTRFWDRLNAEPLDQTGKHTPQNHAEIAYRHLALIWQQLQTLGEEIIVAVPSYYGREQLGLLLGIAQELGMPVRGFMPLTLAAASHVCPEKMLLHLDIHLHRIEVTYLEQGEYLASRDSATTNEKGLIHLYKEWVDAVAQEFVRTTRFDPLHQAASEQKLYDRLPGMLSHFQHNSSILFEIVAAGTPYTITLERDLIIQRAEPIYREFVRLIKRMLNKRGEGQKSVALQLSHRLTRLPGCRQMLATIKNTQIVELDRGAAAIRGPKIWHELAVQHNSEGISFFTSRPWPRQQKTDEHWPLEAKATQALPTHLLHRDIAYPITEKPLKIGCASDREQNDITIMGETARGVAPRHCTIMLRGREIVLNVLSDKGTFVDEKRVSGSIALKLGQKIRVGTPGEQMHLIACLIK